MPKTVTFIAKNGDRYSVPFEQASRRSGFVRALIGSAPFEYLERPDLEIPLPSIDLAVFPYVISYMQSESDSLPPPADAIYDDPDLVTLFLPALYYLDM